MPTLRVARRERAPLAELLEIVQRKLVAGEMQQRVLEHPGMAARQDEAVAVGPGRIGRVMPQMLRVDEVRERRERHGRTGMAGIGLLDRVHRKCPDRVDGQAAQVCVGHVAPRRYGRKGST